MSLEDNWTSINALRTFLNVATEIQQRIVDREDEIEWWTDVRSLSQDLQSAFEAFRSELGETWHNSDRSKIRPEQGGCCWLITHDFRTSTSVDVDMDPTMCLTKNTSGTFLHCPPKPMIRDRKIDGDILSQTLLFTSDPYDGRSGTALLQCLKGTFGGEVSEAIEPSTRDSGLRSLNKWLRWAKQRIETLTYFSDGTRGKGMSYGGPPTMSDEVSNPVEAYLAKVDEWAILNQMMHLTSDAEKSLQLQRDKGKIRNTLQSLTSEVADRVAQAGEDPKPIFKFTESTAHYAKNAASQVPDVKALLQSILLRHSGEGSVNSSESVGANIPKFIFATNHADPDKRDLAVEINKAKLDPADDRSENQIAKDFCDSNEKDPMNLLAAVRKYEERKRGETSAG